MILFTTIGIISCFIFLLYLFVILINYVNKKNENKRKITDDILKFKNKIEDGDLKQSWIKFLDNEYKSPYWNEKLKW